MTPSRVVRPLDKRRRGNPELYRGSDGNIYAEAERWGLHRPPEGIATPVDTAPKAAATPDLNRFPDGSRITRTNFPDRTISIQDAGAAEPREVPTSYKSTGVAIYTIVSGPDGKIYGATGIPMRLWNFDPQTGRMEDSGLGGYSGHCNQYVRQGDKLYGALYSGGQLLEYDPSQPIDDTNMAVSKNPRRVFSDPRANDLFGRPNIVLAHSDGHHILVSGKAARVLLGSGMLVYDTETERGTILDRSEPALHRQRPVARERQKPR